MCVVCDITGRNIHLQGELPNTPGATKLEAIQTAHNKAAERCNAALRLYGDPANFPEQVIQMIEGDFLECVRLTGELRLLVKAEEKKEGVH